MFLAHAASQERSPQDADEAPGFVVSGAVPERLPRGRHKLTREQVVAAQRARMLVAMADAVSEKGYVATSVADVLKRAGVSRETFYQQFSGKHDCFLEVFKAADKVLLGRVTSAHPERGATPLERFEIAFDAYMDTLTDHASFARVFLVEVYAAGDEAMALRAGLQGRIVDFLAELLELRTAQDRFACQALVAAVGSLVVEPLVAGDAKRLRKLRSDVHRLVRRALTARDEPRP